MDNDKRNEIVQLILDFVCDIGITKSVTPSEMAECLKGVSNTLLYFDIDDGCKRLIELIGNATQSKEAN
jgi:hypothetical protein